MGSASRSSIEEAKAALLAVRDRIDLAVAEQLFTAARSIGGSLQLRAIIADQSTDSASKREAVEIVFGPTFSPVALDLLKTAVGSRWSSGDELLGGVEELGLRAAAVSAPSGTTIGSELFAFSRAVSSSAELELAVGSKLGDTASKVTLVDTLLSSKVSPQTLVIVKHLVQQPRGRRIGALVRYAASVVADQSGLAVATVTSARPIPDDQLDRLRRGLSKTYGRELEINPVVDPAVLGGVRVQVGDDVIDGSVASRLNDLRLQLAGT